MGKTLGISRRSFLKGVAASAAGAALLSMNGPELQEVQAEEVFQAEVTYDCDIVIVGAGGTGMLGAITALKAGKKVIVVEKAAACDLCNSSIVAGSTAIGTRLQKEVGNETTVDQVFQHLQMFGQGTVNQPLVRAALERTHISLDTWEECGLTLNMADDRYGVGFVTVHALSDRYTRMSMLEAKILELGGEVLYGHPMQELVMEDGVCKGIIGVNDDGQNFQVNAQAVIIATGGFLFNKDMMDAHFGKANKIALLGSTLTTGDGIQAALNAGAIEDTNFAMSSFADNAGYNEKTSNTIIEYRSADTRNQAFIFALTGGLLVDKHGERFMDEFQLANNPLAVGGAATVRVGYHYAIITQQYVDALMEQSPYDYLGQPEVWTVGPLKFAAVQDRLQSDIDIAIEEGWGFKADSIAELGEMLGMPSLSETVDAYNELCHEGKDTVLCKPAVFLDPIEGDGPFYAFQYQMGGLNTMGGIKTDARCNALNEEDDPIPGLYVAGLDNGSVYNGPYFDVGGTCSGLAWATGILAAEEASKTIM